MVTGMRGLCNGLGPAMFGLIFYMFHVDLTGGEGSTPSTEAENHFETYSQVRRSFLKNVYFLLRF